MTLIIIALTSIISLLAFSQRDLFARLQFNAYLIKNSNQSWRFLSYGLIHADWVHLMVNMFVLYSFGQIVEAHYQILFETKGLFYFGLLYIGSLGMSVVPAYGKNKENIHYNAVGASGAVSAIVFTSILFQPLSKIYFFFIPIGIPAIIFGILYLWYSWYMSKKNIDNIGHDAHFWGAIFGIVFTIAIKPSIILYFFNQITSILR
ncbi:MAG: rhomboid family intramembrane serine protease [Bacteroidales bacterium]|nr:rhomboid family intramembrane serine protease [Bacteroidales bacterium]